MLPACASSAAETSWLQHSNYFSFMSWGIRWLFLFFWYLETGSPELAANEQSGTIPVKGQYLLVFLGGFSLEAQHHPLDLEVQEGLAFHQDLPVGNKMRFFLSLLRFRAGSWETAVSIALCCHRQSNFILMSTSVLRPSKAFTKCLAHSRTRPCYFKYIRALKWVLLHKV